MKGLSILNRKRLLSLLMSIALLVGVSGMTPSEVFAGKKKQITAQVEFSIVVEKVFGEAGHQVVVGKIWFHEYDMDENTAFYGEGKVFHPAAWMTATPEFGAFGLVQAEIRSLGPKGITAGTIGAKLSDVEVTAIVGDGGAGTKWKGHATLIGASMRATGAMG